MAINQNIRSPRTHASLLILLTILSCDSFHEDFIEPENLVTFSQREYYILPGSSIIIDLKSAVKQSFTNVSLRVSKGPSRGELSELDTLLLKYSPRAEFLEGNDQFVFSVLNDNQVVATETMTIIMKKNREELPCGLYTVEDKAQVANGSTVSVEFLKNDRICGINASPLQVSIHSNPHFGASTLVGDSIIVYTPAAGYTGQDQLVYKLADSSGERFSYGVITITVQWDEENSPTPISRLQVLPLATSIVANKMFFVNDKTGFLGGYGLYKTTDGGATWGTSYPITENNLFNITDIYFFDGHHGFASYYSYKTNIQDIKGGLLTTMDGGNTWEVMKFDHAVTSVFFVSPTTGFVATADYHYGSRTPMEILKTVDGGTTWKNVLATSADFGELKIRFSDSKTGYAHHSNNFFRTVDGGESWETRVGNQNIISLAVMPANIISANFSSTRLWDENKSVTTASTMSRSRDGDAWRPTMELPYLILSQGFSPSTNIGFALGFIETDATVYEFDPVTIQTITIHKSINKGATWTEVEIPEPLYGYPWDVSIPSDTVAYFLCNNVLVRYTNP